jgi:hypothetical protein
LDCALKLLFYYFMWILLYDCHSFETLYMCCNFVI